jgi:hypothetical protein
MAHGARLGSAALAEWMTRAMLDFLIELFAFLRSRRKLWLRPILIFLLIIGGLLMLANGFLGGGFSATVEDPVVPFSRDAYRHDAAFFNRYSATSLCPARFG